MISLSYHSPPYWGGAGGRALVFLISLSYHSPPYGGGAGGRASSFLISLSYPSPPYWGGAGGRALGFLISLSYYSPPYWGGAGVGLHGFGFVLLTNLFISSTGFSASSTAPLTAMPVTPVCIMAVMSSALIPPIATIGRLILASCTCFTIR